MRFNSDQPVIKFGCTFEYVKHEGFSFPFYQNSSNFEKIGKHLRKNLEKFREKKFEKKNLSFNLYIYL